MTQFVVFLKKGNWDVRVVLIRFVLVIRILEKLTDGETQLIRQRLHM